MELKGQVNCYLPITAGGSGRPPHFLAEPVYSINLSTGTTPFCTWFDGHERRSTFYRLHPAARTGAAVTVTYAFYRPAREAFGRLAPEVQGHVLDGGLVGGPLAEAPGRGASRRPRGRGLDAGAGGRLHVRGLRLP